MSTAMGPLRLKLTFSSSSFDAGGYQSMMMAVPPMVRTVSDLLHHLQTRPYLFSLKEQCHQWSVSIDGFRLPNESVVREVLRDDELITIEGVPSEDTCSVVYALPSSLARGESAERRIRLDDTSSSSTPKKRTLREIRKGTPKPRGRATSSSSSSDEEEEEESGEDSSHDDEGEEEVVAVSPPMEVEDESSSSSSSSSSDSDTSSSSSDDESSVELPPTPEPKRRKVESAQPPKEQQETIGNNKVRFVAARKALVEDKEEGVWRFDDWHVKVGELKAGQFVKFRSLQADPVTRNSKLTDEEVWKVLAMDEGKAVLVDSKGRHDVIPEKDMFGLLVHEPVSENTGEGDEQKGQENGQHVASPAGKKGPRISSLAYVPPTVSDKSALKRQKKKFGAIRRQVEWWLNKPNWDKDEHLRSLAYPGTHWIPVQELMKFERLRDLSDDQAEVVHVLRTERCGKQDPRLEVSPDGYYVRHKCWTEADTAGGPKKAA
ncbi:hypothetical protein Pmar_PMAR024577 [Perkinsus marinus ATCC 50983]|uniref:HTH La-type RNA-binding domain-containing protein n=1 Tax=Perkinsus marinus (strain ATCC 50983 / TXsc) TaxID=423536 RepID=C5LTC9_PERM5|nr:hypothetical protein Pmar_PMAR024577 [Perkinsus marinus ATCC 50983]EER00097.1 hypothetical protein Pmar_PMAR024577 [Perkinsus marinus ATCC 50983]|eukprot:XP_002767379.1 hypothetical protein Pmar_PMAR024577 [Perkinsus marinus ATCC 50983]